MADRQHEAIAIGPIRLCRIVAQDAWSRWSMQPVRAPSAYRGGRNLPPARHPSTSVRMVSICRRSGEPSSWTFVSVMLCAFIRNRFGDQPLRAGSDARPAAATRHHHDRMRRKVPTERVRAANSGWGSWPTTTCSSTAMCCSSPIRRGRSCGPFSPEYPSAYGDGPTKRATAIMERILSLQGSALERELAARWTRSTRDTAMSMRCCCGGSPKSPGNWTSATRPRPPAADRRIFLRRIFVRSRRRLFNPSAVVHPISRASTRRLYALRDCHCAASARGMSLR